MRNGSDMIKVKVRLYTDFKDLVFKDDSDSEIKSTYKVIVEFIKWYNKIILVKE